VTVTGIGGDLTLRCAYATVRVRDVDGALSVNGSSSPVHAERIGGTVDVETTYGGVHLRDVGGPVNIRNQSGAVSVRGLGGGGLSGSNSIQTSYADIEFHWPGNSSVTFLLESTYGQIDSDLPGRLRERGSRRTFEGTAADGAAELNLVTQSGSIRLRSE